MKNKILLIILSLLILSPLAFGQQSKAGIKEEINKAVAEAAKESNAKIDEKIVGIKDNQAIKFDSFENKLAAAIDKLEIKEENLAYKEVQVGWWLNVLGIFVAFFGVFVPLAITFAAWKIFKEHKKELKNIETELANILIEHEKLQDLKKQQEDEFNNLKNRTDAQQKAFDKLKKDMEVTLDKINQKAGEVDKKLEEASEKLKDVSAKAKDVNQKADEASESQKQAKYSQMLSLANSYMSAKKYEEALKELDEAIELIPKEEEAYFHKGIIYIELKQYDKALAMYDVSIKILEEKERDAKNIINLSIAYSNKGYIFISKDENDEAMKMFNKSLDLNPNNFNAGNNKSTVLIKEGKYPDAITLLKNITNYGFLYGYYNLAKAYLLNGDINEAKEALVTYINKQKSPDILTDDYEIWTKALDAAIAQGNDVAKEMKELIEESITNGKLIKKERK